jgi:hypothetical protein
MTLDHPNYPIASAILRCLSRENLYSSKSFYLPIVCSSSNARIV